MNQIKTLIQNQLAKLAQRIVKKYNPIVIGITGSVGKTSTRDACFWALQSKFTVRKPAANFNNEFGLPLAVLGFDSPGRNILGWVKVFLSGFAHAWLPLTFPEVLILEMGVDKPGDMDYLLEIAQPNIGIITFIGSAHYEFFQSQAAVAKEKLKLIQSLPEDGFAILNLDSQSVADNLDKTKAKVVTYSSSSEAKANVTVIQKGENLEVPAGTHLEIKTNNQILKTFISAIGQGHQSAIGAAVAVATVLEVPVEEITQNLTRYKPVPGRLNFIRGIRKTLLIDDSYNASPDSMRSALSILDRAPRDKKIAVLGDMLELGDLSDTAHQEIGRIVSKLNLYKLFTVGTLGKIIFDTAIEHGMSKLDVQHFDNSAEAAKFMQQNVFPESAILIKGSQSIRMERISKELLFEPMTASQVLPRQYGNWTSN